MVDLAYDGACHCGAIRFRYATAIDPVNWPVRACQCRFCRMHDALSTSDPLGTLQFSASSDEILQRYRFALKTADFLICRRCGVYVGAVIDTAEGKFGIINTRTLEKMPKDTAEGGAINYDNEDEESRISRREERWTPVTAVPWQG
ncbi:MAG: aldehyde-activating protein [Gammaproteobacteria bacterium]|nr:aldehyde-activating protein [Gammaproteobacteria bacterium]MDH3372787.1 aldehyde-activating protein [Gammaproteobacteria bacterium]MDH3408089.1 aldehyde-activating protein [Gammaproteobacteria bacterium]